MNQQGTQLAQWRLAKQWTQEQLAAQLNVTRQTVSKWERGCSIPDVSLLRTLASMFGVTVEQVIAAMTTRTAVPVAAAVEGQSGGEHSAQTIQRVRDVASFRAQVRDVEEQLAASHGQQEVVDLETIQAYIPFFRRHTHEQLFAAIIDGVGDERLLPALLPFLDGSTHTLICAAVLEGQLDPSILRVMAIADSEEEA